MRLATIRRVFSCGERRKVHGVWSLWCRLEAVGKPADPPPTAEGPELAEVVRQLTRQLEAERCASAGACLPVLPRPLLHGSAARCEQVSRSFFDFLIF